MFERFGFKDAFIGPWDVANKVSDLLMLRMNREVSNCGGCDMKTSQTINSELLGHIRKMSIKDMQEASIKFAPIFLRYKLLRDFLDKDEDWSSVEAIYYK